MSNVTALPALRIVPSGAPSVGASRDAAAISPMAMAAPQPTLAQPNPTLRLDASLGLVVLEFRDAGGETRSIPSERELHAYRSAARGAVSGTAPVEPSAQPAPPAADQD